MKGGARKGAKEIFEDFVTSIREVVRDLETMPITEKSEPTIELERSLKAALKSYDASKK